MDFNHRVASPLFRALGNFSLRLSRSLHPLEGLQTRIFPAPGDLQLLSHSPKSARALFVGPSSHLRGNVVLEEDSVVMFNSFLEGRPNKGDEKVRVGKRTVVQDLVSLRAQDGGSVLIGDNCYIGANTSVVNSTIEDGVFIGPGCRLANATIRAGSYLAAGTVVENAEVAANLVVCKSPFEVLRAISVDETEYLAERVHENLELAKIFADFHTKNNSTVVVEKDFYKPEKIEYTDTRLYHADIHEFYRVLDELNLPTTEEDLRHADYREWVLEEMENRRLFGYKDPNFDPSASEVRPPDLFGPFHEDAEKHLKLHERSEQRKGKLLEPDFTFDKEDFDYRAEIARRNQDSNKF